LIHVGNNNWYKNRAGVLRIFSELKAYPEFRDIKLVMVGKEFTAEMRQFIDSRALGSEVVEISAVPNQDLASLYSGALALLFPSLAEGFGWPIIEAQACGCPVITSNREPMREVAGSGALFIEPGDAAAAAAAIIRNLHDLPSFCSYGFENLQRFDRMKIIGEYLGEYDCAAAGLQPLRIVENGAAPPDESPV
jgi:glycosyltransferase involved in cell wall biosynthesis